MANPENTESGGKHSPYRILVIGALLTTIGGIITGAVLSLINDDSSPTPSSELSASGQTRTSSKAPASATPMLAPGHRDKFVAEIGGDLTVESAVDINGERYTYGASGHCEYGCPAAYDDFIEFNLGRDYKTFRATLGLSDRSAQGGTRHMRILADGKLLYEREFALGQSEAVELDVTGALRLRFEVLGVHFYYGAIGDPTVE